MLWPLRFLTGYTLNGTTPVPADITCTSPALIIPLLPMLSWCSTALQVQWWLSPYYRAGGCQSPLPLQWYRRLIPQGAKMNFVGVVINGKAE
jgi:hypothetical protein